MWCVVCGVVCVVCSTANVAAPVLQFVVARAIPFPPPLCTFHIIRDCTLHTTHSARQISIGSMFFPSHPVQSAWDAYRLAMQGRRHMCRIPFYQFAEEGLGVMRGALERSQILNGSGIAISATRGATVNVNMAAAATTTVDLFVRHTKLVSVFLDNVVVRT